MIKYETILEFLQEYGQVHIKGNEMVMRCPLCGDSKKSLRKKRFSVRYENKFPYSCFNCGASGTFVELYAQLKGISTYEAFRIVDTPDFDYVKQSLEKKKKVKKISKTEENNLNSILDDCISIKDDVSGYFPTLYKKELLKFVESRKIPPEYDIFVAIKGEYLGRFIIPIYHCGNIVYFQGRAISPDAYLRYKNPEIDKTGIIMNIDQFKRDKYIIVTEGVIDAMMVENHQGTCVLGGSVSDDFLSILFKHTDKGIIIAVDNDERGSKERKKLLNGNYGKLLKYFIPPHGTKDLNDMKRQMDIEDMYHHVVLHSYDHFTLSVFKSIKK
jgi:DNA primase